MPNTIRYNRKAEAGMKKYLKSSKVEMSIDEFIKEHKRLIWALRHGSTEDLTDEAKRQEKELAKYL